MSAPTGLRVRSDRCAQMLSVTERLLLDLVRRENLPTCRSGSLLFVSPEQAEAALEKRRTEAFAAAQERSR